MKPDFFKITREDKRFLKPITSRNSLDVRDNMHEGGLFSLSIFGQIGTVERSTTFSYIKLNTSIISPVLFHEVAKLSAFYLSILRGSEFGIWNDEEKIFEPSNFEDGDTGYAFFVKHIKEIKWHRNTSKTRDQKIDMIEKYADVLMLSDFMVLPAGLRDYIVSDGKPTEDEINTIYRKLFGLCGLLEVSDGYSKENDAIRYKIQTVVQEVYNHLMLINMGKGGFIQNVWTKRSVMYGTRNVITGSTLEVTDDREDRTLGENDSMVGHYQYVKAIGTKSDYLLRSHFFNRIFGDGVEYTVPLVNPKTGKIELTELSKGQIVMMAKLMTTDGLNKFVIDKLRINSYVHEPLKIGKNFLCNIYDDGKVVRPMFDNIVPDGFDKKHIRPISLIELSSLSVLDDAKDAVGTMTRFPITQQGSIYPTNIYVRTTIRSRKVTVLNDNWEELYKIREFPVRDENLYTSMSVDSSKLGNLGADYDGDKLVLNVVLLEESKKEIKELMTKRIFYVRPSGGYVNSIDDDIVGFVLKHVTRGLKT